LTYNKIILYLMLRNTKYLITRLGELS